MRIIPLSEDLKDRALAFLENYERFCVPLAERVAAGTVPAFLILEGSEIRAVFSWSPGGQIFHCLPWKNAPEKRSLYAALEAFVKDRCRTSRPSLFSINGEAQGTRLLALVMENVLHVFVDHSQLYDFMKWNGKISPRRMEGVHIEKADASMAELLFPLQTAYEKEEVVFDLSEYDEKTSLLSLKKALKKHTVFYLQKDGVPVAKAGTNAKGINYVQLGGVFTKKPERSKGYASLVVCRLLEELAAQNKQAVLFVKKTNAAAHALYESLGFETLGDYEIVYY